MPRMREASKASRRVTTKAAPMGYSAMMVALAVSEWYSPTKGYLPGLSAGILRRTVLPAGMTFSMRGCCMSSSSGPLSLLVMTRTNDCPALTLMRSGWKRFFSMTSGISGAVCALTGSAVPRQAPSNSPVTPTPIHFIRPPPLVIAELGIPNHRNRVNRILGYPSVPRKVGRRGRGGRAELPVGDENSDGVGVADALALPRHGDAQAVVAERGREGLADPVGVAGQREGPAQQALELALEPIVGAAGRRQSRLPEEIPELGQGHGAHVRGIAQLLHPVELGGLGDIGRGLGIDDHHLAPRRADAPHLREHGLGIEEVVEGEA